MVWYRRRSVSAKFFKSTGCRRMHSLSVLVGLICLLPKSSLCYISPLISMNGTDTPEYWDEKCYAKLGGFGISLAQEAKATVTECLDQAMHEDENEFLDTFGERSCRMEMGIYRCIEEFFTILSSCFNDGEADDMLAFFLKLNVDIYNFTCSGPINWKDSFRDSHGYRCIVSNTNNIRKCQRNGPTRQYFDRLIAHARETSSDSFKGLFCRFIFEEQLCIANAMKLCGSHRAESLYENYTNYLKNMKHCQMHAMNGGKKLMINYAFTMLLPLLVLPTWRH